MTHRERILTALDHKTADRLPMDIGGARFAGMVEGSVRTTCLPVLNSGSRAPSIERMMQVVGMDERYASTSTSMPAPLARECPTGAGCRSSAATVTATNGALSGSNRPLPSYYDLCGSPLAGEITARRNRPLSLAGSHRSRAFAEGCAPKPRRCAKPITPSCIMRASTRCTSRNTSAASKTGSSIRARTTPFFNA